MTAVKKPRRKLHKISEEMKVWSAMLATELAGWPGVTTKHFFGTNAMYRKDAIFAALPKTRGMNSPNSLAFKMASVSPQLQTRLESDHHIEETHMQNARWFAFEMESDEDLRAALEWLSEAYEAAGKKR